MTNVSSALRQVVPNPTDIQITEGFDVNAISALDAIVAAAALVAGFVLSRLAKRSVLRVFRGIEGVPDGTGSIVARLVGYAVFIVGLMVALEALGFGWGPLATILILIVIVLLLSARPLLEDMGAGLILQARRPLTPGDLIRVEEYRGEVVEISSRTVRLLTDDGRRVHLPNRWVLGEVITNLTVEGRRLSSFVAGLDYGTDLDRARRIAVTALAAAPGVHPDPVPEALVEEFDDSTINLSCRYWHDPDVMSELRTRDEAMRAVKRAFDRDGIVIAFPQRVEWRAGDVA